MRSYARADPGKLAYGPVGLGSTSLRADAGPALAEAIVDAPIPAETKDCRKCAAASGLH
ncbi:MAG: hypothetical protein ABIH03_02250 [Pseudomonadota bacterium]